MRLLPTLLCLLPLAACDALNGDDDDGGLSGGAGGLAGGAGGAVGGSGGGAEGAGHPCPGRKTEALLCEDDGRCWVGCGTSTNGRGLFVTEDGGGSWAAVTSDPPGFFEQSRVNDVHRSADGLLYVAGEHANDLRVVSLDADGLVGEVFRRGDQVDYSFSVGRFRRDSAGRAIAESLTGTGVVYRAADDPDPQGSWSTGAGFWSAQVPNGVQMLDLALHDDVLYAVGSTIAQPPTVMISTWDEGDFGFDIVQLATEGPGAFDGELWSLAVDADLMAAGGVNQDRDVGVIFTLPRGEGLDPTDPAAWQMTDLSVALGDAAPAWMEGSTWVEGICLGDGALYAVGRESARNFGFALRSTDGGLTWADVSLYGASDAETAMPPLTRCAVVGGEIYIAGDDGYFTTL